METTVDIFWSLSFVTLEVLASEDGLDPDDPVTHDDLPTEPEYRDVISFNAIADEGRVRFG